MDSLSKQLIQTEQAPEDADCSYENFLAAHDPVLRKMRGVFYTPQPAVRYIVRAVDALLQQEFNFPKGIADRNVAILDPSTGAGTFLLYVIEWIYRQHKPAAWNNYVTNDLLPRLHGLEIMETPCEIARKRLTEFLLSTGYRFSENQRFHIHLTNALEPQDSYEHLPFLVIMGNPPYNVSTANQGEYAKKLTVKYKKGLEHETNIQPLSDDYIKFIALGQHLIETTKFGGILAYISNNGFLDGMIHRQMRKSLRETFDMIYILNLHGSIRKKETDPNGGKDENIFCIQQGTSINIFVRNPANQKEPGIFYAGFYGKRLKKLNALETQTLETSNVTKIHPQPPDFFFVPKDLTLKEQYDQGFGVHQLFIEYGTGIKFRRDNLLVKNHFNRRDVETMLRDIAQLGDEQLLSKYKTKETKDWTLKEKRQYFLNDNPGDLVPVLYRVFDLRWTYYPIDKISHIIPRGDARKKLMRHLFQNNLVLLTLRNQPTVQKFDRVFLAQGIIEHCVIGRGTYAFPLYYYDEAGTKCLNLNKEIVQRIECTFPKGHFSRPEAIGIFDYVYGVLHAPHFREKFQVFLQMDFPRIPYPKDAAEFDRYAQVGSTLRKLHLLEGEPAIQTTFPVTGNNDVKNVRSVGSKVFINETQYFKEVSAAVWEFSIGGSCPAQKYLKDRKGRTLSCEEIQHYQKVVAVLKETISIQERLTEPPS